MGKRGNFVSWECMHHGRGNANLPAGNVPDNGKTSKGAMWLVNPTCSCAGDKHVHCCITCHAGAAASRQLPLPTWPPPLLVMLMLSGWPSRKDTIEARSVSDDGPTPACAADHSGKLRSSQAASLDNAEQGSMYGVVPVSA